MNVIKNRRTCREFRPERLRAETVRLLLEAARWAPSAANTQPWELIVVDDLGVKEELQRVYLEESLQHDDVHYRNVSKKQAELILAPILLGVCGNVGRKEDFIDAEEMSSAAREELFLLTMGAMIENVLLMAASLGVASTWIARLARVHQVVDIIGLPKGVRPVAFVALGYGAQTMSFRESFRLPIEKKTHHNRFGRRIEWALENRDEDL